MKRLITALLALAAVAPGTWCPARAQAPGPVPETRFERGAAFLSRIRLADPNYRFVLMAFLREGELNILFSRHVTAEEVPVLTKGLLAELQKALPDQDLSVVTFRPVVPLREAAVARFDSRSGQTSYTAGAAP